jgi:hypothetical protein
MVYYTHYLPKLISYINKVAASRLDKEVAEGAASYSDVDPRIPRSMGESSIAKRISRASGQAPVPRTSEELNRTRSLNAALFNNAHLRGRYNTELDGYPIQQLTPGSARLNPGASEYTLRNELHAMGPATLHSSAGPNTVYAPDTSSRFLRTTSEPFGPFRAGVTSGFGAAPGIDPNIKRKLVRTLLAPEADVDRTLNYGILEHELGESDRLGARDVAPHSSHMGIEPIGRENMALRGDPEAQAIISKIRNSSHDDALMQRKLREAGNTASSPLPVGGRAMRSVERNIAANPQQLSKATRANAVSTQLKQEFARQFSGASPEEMPNLHNVMTLPENLKDSIRQTLGKGHTAYKDVVAMPDDKKLLGGLRRALSLYGDVRPHLSALNRFTR